MEEKLRKCWYCGEILPPWRLTSCDGTNKNGRGNCEVRNGSGGECYHPEMGWSSNFFWEKAGTKHYYEEYGVGIIK